MKIFLSSKRKPNFIETDDGKEFENKIFTDLLHINNIKRYSYTSLGAVFAERFKTIRDLLKKPVFEKGDDNWVDVLPSIVKKYNDRIHSSTKLTPIQASLKMNEGFVYQNLLDKRKRIKPKYKIHDIFRTADLKKTFSRGDTTNWSYIF